MLYAKFLRYLPRFYTVNTFGRIAPLDREIPQRYTKDCRKVIKAVLSIVPVEEAYRDIWPTGMLLREEESTNKNLEYMYSLSEIENIIG